MKFTKFIPVALALAFVTVPAFADPVTKSNNYDVTVPSYFNITERTGAVKTATGVIAEDGSGNISMTYTTPMTVTYRVVNNNADKVFYIKGSATGESAVNAFSGTPGSLKVAFANTTAGALPTNDAIANAIGEAAEASNANCFALTAAVTKSIIIGEASVLPDPAMESNKVKFTGQPGTYDVTLTFGTAALADTFSSRDQQGLYRAVVTITDAAS